MMKKTMTRAMATVLGTALLVSMAGCGGNSSAAAAGTTSGTSGGTSGGASGGSTGEVVYKTSLVEELNSLDPNYNYSATSMGFIMNTNEGLYKYLEDGTIGMGLAEKVDISEDGCT